MSTIKVDTIATRTGSGNITSSNTIDLNGNELILDVDGDTSLTADTDDQIDIRIGGTDVGVIGSTSSRLHIVNGDTGLRIAGDIDQVFPCGTSGADRDNAIDLGSSGVRFKDLYLGGGLYVGGTGAANKLDDYEEGTWTPVLTDGSTDVSLGASGSGVYTKIGNLVTVSFDKYNVSISSLNTTDLSIKTLPFASNANSLGNKIIHVTGTSGGSNVPVLVYPVSGSQTLALYKAVSSSQNMAQLTKSDLASSISIRLTLTYFTDS